MSIIIGFDSLPAGTVITNQFQSRGITFSGGTTQDNPAAPSARNALKATDMNFTTPEFPVASVSGKFTDPHHSQVGVSIVLSQGAQFGGTATLVVYDISDNEIARILIEVPVGQQSKYDEIFSPAKNIARFKVSGGGNSSFMGIDNVTFDDLTVPQLPDFQMKYFGNGMRLAPGNPGDNVGAVILLIRLNGSSGDIHFSVTNLPPGVELVHILPSGDIIDLQLRANNTAFPIQDWNIVVNGSPSPSAGTVQRSISVPVTVLDSYDARIVGVEVTQGIQVYDLPDYRGAIRSQQGRNYKDGGVSGCVDLAKGGLTKVRVFANLRTQPKNSSVPPMDCLLHGFRGYNDPLPGSPLSPENGVSLQPGLDYVEDHVRADANGGFNFTLPPSWTEGYINLRAEIAPTPSFFPPDNGESVYQNNYFELLNIPFTPTLDVDIAPFELRITNPDDGGLYGPNAVLEDARNLLPIGEHQFHCPLSYSMGVDITDIYNQNAIDVGFGRAFPVDSTLRGTLVAARLRDRADEFGYNQGFAMVVGIFAAVAADRIRGMESRACTGPFWDCDALSVAVFQDSGRPLSSAAHELGHLFGRAHASAASNAGQPPAEDAQDWPPDQQGFIQGVGLDRRTGRVLFPDRSGGNMGAAIYDFMGYRGQNGNYDPDKWISVRGWNDTLRNALATGTPGSLAPLAVRSARQMLMRPLSSQQLIVHAVHDHTGNYFITKVAPGHDALEESDPDSHYRLSVRGEDGGILCEVGMRVGSNHSEHSADSQFLVARVAVKDVSKLESVEIAYKGRLVAKRIRSKELPTVTHVIVTPDIKTDRGRRTTIKWKATHPEKRSMMTKVDFSTDAGTTWLPIHFGPNTNEVELESSRFSASCQAMIRVRVSDGFNESQAYSCCFSTAGRPPLVRIKSLAECAKIRRGATLYLSGEAYDDRQQPITGKQLVWTIGKRLVGTGATASVSMLKPGIYSVKLTATDNQKRSTTKKSRLTVIV